MTDNSREGSAINWRRGGPFDAPPYCPICGRIGSHFHSPDAVEQNKKARQK